MADPIINRDAPRLIGVARPSLSVAEADAARDCILAGQVAGGPRVADFEATFAAAHGKRHGVACNSGTTALHLALAASGVGPGDQVILPTLTMVAVANAVLYCGSTPVFVDSDPETGNPAAAELDRVVSSRTRAVIVPHLYGVPAEHFLSAIGRSAPHAVVIEDCAEAHYATFACGAPAGSRGWFSCWSFYGNKIVTTGEGGLVATNDGRMAERLRSLRSHAFTPGNHFHHNELAYGYRMSEMQAAVGLVQHARRGQLLARRQAIAERYIERLGAVAGIDFQARTFGSVWWVFPILARDAGHKARLRAALADAGVDTRSYFMPLHRQPHLRRYASSECPVADELAARGLYLPLYMDLSGDDVNYICATIEGTTG